MVADIFIQPSTMKKLPATLLMDVFSQYNWLKALKRKGFGLVKKE